MGDLRRGGPWHLCAKPLHRAGNCIYFTMTLNIDFERTLLLHSYTTMFWKQLFRYSVFKIKALAFDGPMPTTTVVDSWFLLLLVLIYTSLGTSWILL